MYLLLSLSSTDRLLLINDLINQVCERHKAYSKGDFSVTVTIDPSYVHPLPSLIRQCPLTTLSPLILRTESTLRREELMRFPRPRLLTSSRLTMRTIRQRLLRRGEPPRLLPSWTTLPL